MNADYSALAFKLNDFEGPMDLLMHLLEKNKIDISDIPIAQLTDQYLAYLREAESMNLEIASGFVLMAANLVRIKVRMLMPRLKVDEENDPRRELVAQILEYRLIRETADFLKQRYAEEEHQVPRLVDTADLAKQYQAELPLKEVPIQALLSAYESVIKAMKTPEPAVHLTRAEISIEDYAVDLLDQANERGKLTFSDLCRTLHNKYDVIGYFLALLECLHRNAIQLIQTERFGEIWLHPQLEGNYEY